MKKMIYNLLLITFALSAKAQISNGGFEEWVNYTKKDVLTHYRMGDDIQQYQPAEYGEYAIKLITTKPIENETSGAEFNVISNSWNSNPIKSGGVAYNQKPTKFHVYAKYDIKEGDAATIGLFFRKNGKIIHEVKDNLFLITGNNTDEWKRLDFNINGLTEVPDTVGIIISSSCLLNVFENTQYRSKAGTYIILDNMSFDTPDPIPYGDFEEWGRTIEYPKDMLIVGAYDLFSDFNVTSEFEKTGDAHGGNSALKIKTYYNEDWEQIICNTVSGNFITGTYQRFNCTAPAEGVFTGWYKYFPSINNKNDKASISITFYDANNQIIEYGWLAELNATNEYTKFQVPYNLPFQPTKAELSITTSTEATEENVGSTLYLDDLALVNPAETTLNSANSIGAYLSRNNILEVTGIDTPSTLSIYDTSGKIVNSFTISGNTSIPLSDLSNGIYIIKVKSPEKLFTIKVEIQ